MEMEIQHQIVVVVSADLDCTVLQSVDYIHEEHPQSKLVRAVVSDVLHYLVEIDGFLPAHILHPAAPAPIVFIAATLAQAVAASIVFALLSLAAVVSQVVSEALFADIMPVVVTAFYALCPQPQLEH